MLSLNVIPVFVTCLLVIGVVSTVHGECSYNDLFASEKVCLVRNVTEVQIRSVESLDDCERMCCTPEEYPAAGVDCGGLRYTGGTCTLFTADNVPELYRKYSTKICDKSVQFEKLCPKGNNKETICSYSEPRTRDSNERCLNTKGEGVKRDTTRSMDRCKYQCSQSTTCLAFAYLPVNQCVMYFTEYGHITEELKTSDCDNSVNLVMLPKVMSSEGIGSNIGIGG